MATKKSKRFSKLGVKMDSTIMCHVQPNMTLSYTAVLSRYYQKIGTFSSTASRALSYHVCERHWGFEAIVDHIQDATDDRARNPGIGHRHASAAI
jgi:hypothetical protein